MNGIDSFKNWFAGFSDEYVIIGGAACDILATSLGLDARATKDIDIVLLIERMTNSFARRFWEYIRIMGYENRSRGDGSRQCYRFTHPADPAAPKMIELFAHHIDQFPLPADARITPIPLDDPLSDLSGILLEESYYRFLTDGSTVVDGVVVLDALHMIPLKAKAWLNLMDEQAQGSHPVRKHDIRKHPGDIVFLLSMLKDDDQIRLPLVLYRDLELFLTRIKGTEFAEQYRDGNIDQQLRQVYLAPDIQVV